MKLKGTQIVRLLGGDLKSPPIYETNNLDYFNIIIIHLYMLMGSAAIRASEFDLCLFK